MGNCSSDDRHKEIVETQKILAGKVKLPIEVLVAHFTPSSFPMMPTIDAKCNKLCETSWSKIISNNIADEYGGSISGMTVFYNEFYERLSAIDSNGRFEAVLSRHSNDSSKIAAKGAILIRIINFVLRIETNDKPTQMTLFMLGKSHSQKNIRPWQYSVFAQTLLITISSRLGTAATNHVMEAWVNLFAFVLQSMLPPAIQGQVVETELNINTSSEFADGRVAQEVAELEEVQEVRRKMKAASSQGSKSLGTRSIGGGSEHGGNDKAFSKPKAISRVNSSTSLRQPMQKLEDYEEEDVPVLSSRQQAAQAQPQISGRSGSGSTAAGRAADLRSARASMPAVPSADQVGANADFLSSKTVQPTHNNRY